MTTIWASRAWEQTSKLENAELMGLNGLKKAFIALTRFKVNFINLEGLQDLIVF